MKILLNPLLPQSKALLCGRRLRRGQILALLFISSRRREEIGCGGILSQAEGKNKEGFSEK